MSELAAYVNKLLKEDPLFQYSEGNDSIGKRVAFNVKRIRKLKEFTQLELADAMGVKQPFVARIESGKNNISIKKLEQIAKVFAIDPMLLLRPIYEEGTAHQVGRMVVDHNFIIQAVNTGMELYYKDICDCLVGTAIKSACPIRKLVSEVYQTGKAIVDYPLIIRENGLVQKTYVTVQPLRGDKNQLIGSEVTSRMDF